MLQMLCSTVQPVHNGMATVHVVAYKLSLCMQSGPDASTGMIDLTGSMAFM